MASPAYAAVTSVAGGFKTGAQNIAVPASGANAADDLMVIWVYKETLSAGITSTNFLKPSDGSSGFDEVANTSHSIYVGYKRLTANDTGNYSVNVGVDNSWTEMVCIKVTGAITSGNPFDVINSATSVGNVTAAPSATVTTTVTDTLLAYAATNVTGGAWTPASGMTERYDGGGDMTVDTLAQAATGSSGAKSATCAGSGRSISWLGAIKSPSTGTSANAENAAGTGTANTAAVAIGVNAENAAGTGTANNPTVSTATATSANAENAAATGTAYDATVSTVPGTNAPAGLASGTGTANAPTASVGVLADVASGTGTAYNMALFEFPETILGLVVEIAPGAVSTDDPDDWPWVDVTQYVLARTDPTPIKITRGATSETGLAPVARATFQLNNAGGRFSTQNYLGPYWPDLVKGTPVRVRIDDGPVVSTRFVGRMDELPPRWDTSGNDRWVPVTASGIMRRLGVGLRAGVPASGVTVPPAVTSASRAVAECVASWPCTDTFGDSADEVIADDAELSRNSSASLVWAQVVGPDGMTLLPSLELGGVLSGAVPSYTTSSEWTVEVAAQIDARSPGTTLTPLVVDTSGTAGEYSVQHSGGTLSVLWQSAGGTVATVASALWPLRDGAWHTWSLRTAQSGGNITVDLQLDATSICSGTITSQTTGDLRYVRLGDGQSGGGIVSMGYARVFRSSSVVTTTITEATAGYTTETADVRFERLCLAQGVPYEVFGTSAQLMGPQSTANFLGQLRECETVDAGLLSESRGGRVAFYCRSLKENAVVALTLDMSAGEVAPPFEPDDSDATTVNSQTVTLSWDSTVTATVTDDAHIATYQLYEGGSLSINAASHSQIPPHAGLRVWLGTYTGYHYPKVSINLARNPELAVTASALDFHQRITLANPSEPPGEDIDLLLIGCAEELGAFSWAQTWTTTPYTPWEIPLVAATPASGDGTGWLLPDTLVFGEDVDLTETAIGVQAVPVLPTAVAHYPVRIRHGAEQMTATACSGAGPTQTLTVTRATAGIATTHANGDPIEIVDALVLAL